MSVVTKNLDLAMSAQATGSSAVPKSPASAVAKAAGTVAGKAAGKVASTVASRVAGKVAGRVAGLAVLVLAVSLPASSAGADAGAGAGAGAASPIGVSLPAPGGPYPVGTVAMRLVDRSRPDPLLTAKAYREIGRAHV